jgi:hypothetical protein
MKVDFREKYLKALPHDDWKPPKHIK